MPQLNPPSELVCRNLELFQGHLLLAGDSRDAIAAELSRQPAVTAIEVFSQDWAAHQALNMLPAGCQCHFGASYPGPGNLDQLVLYLPKAKPQAEMLLALLLPSLKPGADVVLVGENRGGINAAPKLLAPYCNHIVKRDSARRCSLYHAVLDQVPTARSLADFEQNYELQFADTEIRLVSLPGVFSHGRLDDGTQLLLNTLSDLPSGRILDIGCGAGIIGAYLGKHQPEAELELLDVSALALEASQLTLQANDLTGKVYASDGLENASGQYDLIISNPPFHTGLGTDYQPTETLLRQAKKFLKPGGELRIVANAFLKYPPIIQQQFGHCDTLAETRKFRVYRATRQ